VVSQPVALCMPDSDAAEAKALRERRDVLLFPTGSELGGHPRLHRPQADRGYLAETSG